MRFVQFRFLKDTVKATRIGLQKKSGGIVDLSEALPTCNSLVDALGKLGGKGLIERARLKYVKILKLILLNGFISKWSTV